MRAFSSAPAAAAILPTPLPRNRGRLFKIESVGATYLVGAGLPHELPAARTAYLLARFCLDVASYAATFFDDETVPVSCCCAGDSSYCVPPSAMSRTIWHLVAAHLDVSPDYGRAVQLKAGIHSGPLVAGVVGSTRRFYRVFGDTGAFGRVGCVSTFSGTRPPLSQ